VQSQRGKLRKWRSQSFRAETAKLYSGLAKMRIFDASQPRAVNEAVTQEPDYAPSHAALATTLLHLGYDGQAVAEAKKL